MLKAFSLQVRAHIRAPDFRACSRPRGSLTPLFQILMQFCVVASWCSPRRRRNFSRYLVLLPVGAMPLGYNLAPGARFLGFRQTP